ncbi:DUF4062 domain-containing protein [Janthinobacterium sp. LB3P112]|uniref:DUF4062 domain-containing protein n=1 Tax=Janthinobacterium sp. LB3P112 TaxID=3424196 RepID=UPI003F22C1CC
MKIFISSLIGGFEQFRAAAQSAIVALRHEPVVAEDFGAQATSPQIACLQGLRSANLVVLILGSRYGYIQGSSGVSPTHEEYLEARGSKPILMFVQEGVERDDLQAKFISEVGAWQAGHFRAGFKTADELRDLVTRALHDYQLANTAGPLDKAALSAAALSLLPKARQNSHASPTLLVSIVGGPIQQILRPAELEAPVLAEALHQQALFIEPKLFVRSKGVDCGIEGAALVLEQERGAKIQLEENGSILLRLCLDRTELDNRSGFGAFAVIEEDVLRELSAALAFGAWLLDKIDPTQRITHVALAASIEASEYMGWRTRAEQEASPNSGTMRMASGKQAPTSSTDRPRAALLFQAAELAEDLMVPLRRQMKA